MDLTALMQKLAAINTQQIVVETKQVITESVATVRYSTEPVFTSSIARSLAEEFGYALDEEGGMKNDDPNNSAVVDANAKKMQANRAAQDAAAGKVVGSGTTPPPGAAPAAPAAAGQAARPAAPAPADNRNIFQKGFDGVADFHKKNTERFNAKQAADAAANSPEGMAAAKANLTKSQLAWLGGAQPSPEILQRMPAPLPGEAETPADDLNPEWSPGAGHREAERLIALRQAELATRNDTANMKQNQGSATAAAAPVTTPAQRATGAAARAAAAAKAAANALDPSKQTKPDDSPETSMGAGSGAPRVGPNTTIPANSAAANAERDGVPTAAVATPVAPPAPNTATALPPLTPAAAAGSTTDPRPAPVDRISKVSSQLAPAAGAEEKKIARFKELLDKAKATDTATKESIGYFLNKLRFIESRQLNEALSAAEQKEMDGLAAELGGQGSENNPAIATLIKDYNSTTVKPAAAAAGAAPVTQSSGRPADAAAMANANWSYAEKGSDVDLAINNGFGYDVAKWKAAGSPGKPKPADSAPPAGSLTWDDQLSINQQDTLNKQMAKPEATAKAKPGADGAVGQDLLKMGVTKQQRLDQAFVDSTLGVGKFTAGSAESNLALQAHFKKKGTVNQIGAAPATRGMGDTFAVPKKLAPGIGIATGKKPEGTPDQRPAMYKDPRIVGDELPAAAPAPAASAPKPAASAPKPAASPPPPSRATGIVNRRVPAPPTRAESIVTQDDAILSMIRNIRVS